MAARGVLYIHSAPPAVCPHLEWAASRVLGMQVRLEWTAQSADPSAQRTECVWTGKAGTAGELAAALRQWPMCRFEVTEEASPGMDGERISYLPGRGVFRSETSATGDIVVGENRLRAMLAKAASPHELAHDIEGLLGTAWDIELEPYRHGGDGAPVTWLTQVG